jgi:hypothetical protein
MWSTEVYSVLAGNLRFNGEESVGMNVSFRDDDGLGSSIRCHLKSAPELLCVCVSLAGLHGCRQKLRMHVNGPV